jgi:hypothetical protein
MAVRSMAKKKSETPKAAAAPPVERRRTPRTTSTTARSRKPATAPAADAPVDLSQVSQPAPIDTAADLAPSIDIAGTDAPAPVYEPSYDEIAEAAYHRYLRRNGAPGDQVNDWFEAERELRSRQR